MRFPPTSMRSGWDLRPLSLSLSLSPSLSLEYPDMPDTLEYSLEVLLVLNFFPGGGGAFRRLRAVESEPTLVWLAWLAEEEDLSRGAPVAVVCVRDSDTSIREEFRTGSLCVYIDRLAALGMSVSTGSRTLSMLRLSPHSSARCKWREDSPMTALQLSL